MVSGEKGSGKVVSQSGSVGSQGCRGGTTFTPPILYCALIPRIYLVQGGRKKVY